MVVDHFQSQKTARSAKERFDIIARHDKKASSDYLNFGFDYFDNSNYGLGYGGYKYDGRYKDIVKGIIDFYKLKKGDRILEIGCAKGFVLIEFKRLGMNVKGWDKSVYAVENCHPELKSDILLADSESLPFPDKHFDFVFGKEVLPHLNFLELNQLLDECIRVGKKNLFFEIQTGKTEKELEALLAWDKTHQTVKDPEWWNNFLTAKKYPGDVNYKILMPNIE